MERGSLFYYEKRYLQAAQVFSDANKLVDELYTKSVKEAIASSIMNDNSNSFYGALYERSLLYQYQALSFFQLAKRGSVYQSKLIDGKNEESLVSLSEQDIKKNLDRVRSTLIAWDSFFQEFSRSSRTKTFLKHDLLAKLMASELHEALGGRRDLEIALQLYKDAYDILENVGPTQKIFNKNYEKFNRELKDFYDTRAKKPELNSQELTQNFTQLENSIKLKILRLTKKIRRNQYAKTEQKLKPTEEIKTILKQKPSNVSILIEEGVISELEGKDFSYNLRSAIDGIEDENTRSLIRGIGVPVLTYFALGPLGLGTITRHGSVSVYSRHNIGDKMTEEVGIEFELPFAKPSENTKSYKLEVYQKEIKVSETDLTPLSSLSDYAFINSQEMIANSFTKRATRVGVKYVTAIIAAYTTYKSMTDNGAELFAKAAAVGQFLISQKAIKETEKADARHWGSLPSQVLNTEFRLTPGTYTLKYVEYSYQTNERKRLLDLGDIVVNKSGKSVFSYRAF